MVRSRFVVNQITAIGRRCYRDQVSFRISRTRVVSRRSCWRSCTSHPRCTSLPDGTGRGCAGITGPAAHSARAYVVLRARIPVVAACPVGLVGEAARPIPVARPCLMALVWGCAGITGPATHSARAHVVLRARVPVVTACPVGLVGEAARPIPVARPCLMALVRRSAGITGPAAHSARAYVVLRARIPVVAACPVGLVGKAARPIPVARPCLMALVRRSAGITGPAAHSARAHVVLRARVPVVADRPVGQQYETVRAENSDRHRER